MLLRRGRAASLGEYSDLERGLNPFSSAGVHLFLVAVTFVQVHMCRGKVSTRSCVYYNNVEGNVVSPPFVSLWTDPF